MGGGAHGRGGAARGHGLAWGTVEWRRVRLAGTFRLGRLGRGVRAWGSLCCLVQQEVMRVAAMPHRHQCQSDTLALALCLTHAARRPALRCAWVGVQAAVLTALRLRSCRVHLCPQPGALPSAPGSVYKPPALARALEREAQALAAWRGPPPNQYRGNQEVARAGPLMTLSEPQVRPFLPSCSSSPPLCRSGLGGRELSTRRHGPHPQPSCRHHALCGGAWGRRILADRTHCWVLSRNASLHPCVCRWLACLCAARHLIRPVVGLRPRQGVQTNPTHTSDSRPAGRGGFARDTQLHTPLPQHHSAPSPA